MGVSNANLYAAVMLSNQAISTCLYFCWMIRQSSLTNAFQMGWRPEILWPAGSPIQEVGSVDHGGDGNTENRMSVIGRSFLKDWQLSQRQNTDCEQSLYPSKFEISHAGSQGLGLGRPELLWGCQRMVPWTKGIKRYQKVLKGKMMINEL